MGSLLGAFWPTQATLEGLRRYSPFEIWIPYSVPKAADPGEMVIRLVWPGVRYTWGLGER